MVTLEVEEWVDYTQYSNRQLLVVPLAVLGLAILVIAGWYVMTGAPVNPGLEFTGGTEIQIATADSPAEIRANFDTEVAAVRQIPAEDAAVVTFQSTDGEALEREAQAAGYEVLDFQSTSASFGAGTQRLALYGVIAAFIGMSIIVFLLFRTFIPSVAVVTSAFSDIMIPVALMDLLGIKLSLGTVAALLMLIGYSVDSDILLNNHILRRRGGFYESAYRAMRTGVTMTLTSLSAVIVMAIVAFLFGIDLLTAIGIVLAFGLVADLMNTYLLNMALLRWYRGVEV